MLLWSGRTGLSQGVAYGEVFKVLCLEILVVLEIRYYVVQSAKGIHKVNLYRYHVRNTMSNVLGCGIPVFQTDTVEQLLVGRSASSGLRSRARWHSLPDCGAG